MHHFDHAGGVLLLKRRYGARVAGAPEAPSRESLVTLNKLAELDIRLAYTGHNGAEWGGLNEMVRERLSAYAAQG